MGVKYRGGRKRKRESAASCKCYNKIAGCPHKMTKQEQRQGGRRSGKGGKYKKKKDRVNKQ